MHSAEKQATYFIIAERLGERIQEVNEIDKSTIRMIVTIFDGTRSRLVCHVDRLIDILRKSAIPVIDKEELVEMLRNFISTCRSFGIRDELRELISEIQK